MNERFSQLDAVDAARIINRARPQWDPPGIVKALHRIAPVMTIDQALTAALKAAADPLAKTPDAITWEKHHTPSTPAATNDPPPNYCKEHDIRYTTLCGGCRADRIAQKPQAAPTRAASSIPKETE